MPDIEKVEAGTPSYDLGLVGSTSPCEACGLKFTLTNHKWVALDINGFAVTCSNPPDRKR